jgi:hypothetical protein
MSRLKVPSAVAALVAVALAACGSTTVKKPSIPALDMTGIPKAVEAPDGHYIMTFPAGVNVTGAPGTGQSVCATKDKQIRLRLKQAGLADASATTVELDGGNNAPGTMALCGKAPYKP